MILEQIFVCSKASERLLRGLAGQKKKIKRKQVEQNRQT
jgi:hypothetical protein